jgi:glutathione S-transferase
VISVLDGVLAKSEDNWLVGGKCTYADLAFVTWAHVAEGMFAQTGTLAVLEKYPAYMAWLKRMGEKDSVRESVDAIKQGRKAHGLPP